MRACSRSRTTTMPGPVLQPVPCGRMATRRVRKRSQSGCVMDAKARGLRGQREQGKAMTQHSIEKHILSILRLDAWLREETPDEWRASRLGLWHKETRKETRLRLIFHLGNIRLRGREDARQAKGVLNGPGRY